MAKFIIDQPEKTYNRFEVEADNIVDALAQVQLGGGELVPFNDNYYGETLSPDAEPWLHVTGESKETPYMLVNGEWQEIENG